MRRDVCAGITRKIRTLLKLLALIILRRRVHYNAIWYISETFLSIEFSFVSPYYPAETKAWVGIVPASIAHGSEWENDNHYVEFKHVSETLQGMFKIMKNCLDHYLTTFLSLFSSCLCKIIDKNDPNFHNLWIIKDTWTFSNPGSGKWTVRLHDSNSNGKEIAYASFIVLEEITIWAGSIIDGIRYGYHFYGQKKSPEFKIILQLNEKIKSIKFAKHTGSVITVCNLQVGADLNFEPNRLSNWLRRFRYIPSGLV